jgi:PAS domain S-box-containing protein
MSADKARAGAVAARRAKRVRAEVVALRESRKRLRLILDNIQAGILLIESASHTIVDVNPTACLLIGATRQQLVGKVCHNYVCPAEVGRCPITDLKQEVDNSERALLTMNGKRREIIKTVVPVTLDGTRHLLECFVDITARKAAESALRLRTQQLEAIRAIGAEIARELDPPALLKLILQRAMALTGATAGMVFLWREQAEVLRISCWAGLEDWVGNLEYRLGECLTGTVGAHRQGVRLDDYAAWPKVDERFMTGAQVRAVVSEPLLHGDRLVGVITLIGAESGYRFSRQDQEILSLFASQAAVAVEHAQLFEGQRRACEQLRVAQEDGAAKLRQLMESTRTVTHDLNNSLATALGQLELLKLGVTDPKLHAPLDALERALTATAETTRRLSTQQQ